MNANFDRCFEFVIEVEVGSTPNGGYKNDPTDPGGETKWGISKRAHPNVDIKNLTKNDVMEIYRQEYWLPAGCDKRSWPWDLILFDTAVHTGLKRAGILYQENPDWKDYLFKRIEYYVNITSKTKNKYIKGWIKRVLALHAEARTK